MFAVVRNGGTGMSSLTPPFLSFFIKGLTPLENKPFWDSPMKREHCLILCECYIIHKNKWPIAAIIDLRPEANRALSVRDINIGYGHLLVA
jgi:hypothetical protein